MKKSEREEIHAIQPAHSLFSSRQKACQLAVLDLAMSSHAFKCSTCKEGSADQGRQEPFFPFCHLSLINTTQTLKTTARWLTRERRVEYGRWGIALSTPDGSNPMDWHTSLGKKQKTKINKKKRDGRSFFLINTLQHLIFWLINIGFPE